MEEYVAKSTVKKELNIANLHPGIIDALQNIVDEIPAADVQEVKHGEMKEKFYLFQFDNDSTYEMTCGISFKDALWEMSKYTGRCSEMLLKALKGYDENDIDGMINLFEYLSVGKRIQAVYIVEKKIYDWNTRETKYEI